MRLVSHGITSSRIEILLTRLAGGYRHAHTLEQGDIRRM